ncbi:MAG TPA: T9SS type A sorting domain-containing protein [Ferruginibacter sp.]|nr:T9SS type A sorting domain-containing protein [Ferruginibacter sp.]
MKRFFLAIVICFYAWQPVHAQYTMIFDNILRMRLQTMFPSCFNSSGEMDTTCTAITTLRHLDLHANGPYNPTPQITYLNGIQYFDSLRYLNCSGNALAFLPPLPQYLDTLICSYQFGLTGINGYDLGSLPTLPATLKYLDISRNGFVHLSGLNEGLRWLNCSNSKAHMSGGFDMPTLQTIDSLPSTLVYLDCGQNMLVSLPPLPPGLQVLKAQNNKFSYNLAPYNFNFPGIACLPILPQSLDSLWVGGNRPVTCLPNAVPGLYVDMVLEYCNLNNNPNGCPSAGPVPVQLTQFTVNKQTSTVLIQWTTAQEANSDYFMVERSSDQLTWTPIRRVIAAGNSSVEKNYRTTDDIPARGINYYRIRSVDRDGQYALTTIKSVWWNSNSSILASPNPTRDRVTIYYAGNNKPVTISLYEPNGRLVKRLQSNSDQAVLDLSLLSAGSYFVQITGDAIQETSRLIKE